ncbi:FJX1 [Lepeophtheirus salmonis]|uniref:FJX1 n=1 Tax=Lepeophtheirus salmonis TaxID=72036 RepID=A0A7R8D524_LEPSM|nr:FJX1 [Lepeophtheirus salmonis]CAF2976448.1 FJX1 [Lepeophtheirus salmonis]
MTPGAISPNIPPLSDKYLYIPSGGVCMNFSDKRKVMVMPEKEEDEKKENNGSDVFLPQFILIVQNRTKLIVLGCIAALALFSICVIGEELISRRFNRKKLSFHSQRQQIYEVMSRRPKPVGISSPITNENGLFWSPFIEAAVSPGLNDIETDIIMKKLREKRVSKALKPDWLHCGRDKNRYVIFEDGSEACSRNREPRFIQGEVMAFYLARFIGLRNTPAVVLSKLSSKQWKSVDLEEPVIDGTPEITALIQWIPNLVKDIMPQSFELAEMSNEELSTLIQWGDMIIFDYLTGNFDRVASMQDAAVREKRPSILKETIHNLVRSTDTSSLWLIDNESAFLSGYSLMYEEEKGERFLDFHAKALGSLCVFRRRTIERLEFLEKQTLNPAELLLGFINKREPLFKELPPIQLDSLFSAKFKERIFEVMEWFRYCKDRSPLVMA